MFVSFNCGTSYSLAVDTKQMMFEDNQTVSNHNPELFMKRSNTGVAELDIRRTALERWVTKSFVTNNMNRSLK